MTNKEALKKIVTGKVAMPKLLIGFVPGEKFKTQQEVDAAIEEELKKGE